MLPEDQESHVVLCSRRFGKSFVLCSWAIEICISTPNAIIKYACPEKQQAEEIVTDIIPNYILNDCPEYLMPVWKEQKKHFLFPNGSKLQIAGTNKDRGNALRGGRANLCIVDEAQDHKYASYPADLSNNPFIQAEVNAQGHNTGQEASDAILATAAGWKTIAANIEEIRLDYKNQVDAALTPENVSALSNKARATLDAI